MKQDIWVDTGISASWRHIESASVKQIKRYYKRLKAHLESGQLTSNLVWYNWRLKMTEILLLERENGGPTAETERMKDEARYW